MRTALVGIVALLACVGTGCGQSSVSLALTVGNRTTATRTFDVAMSDRTWHTANPSQVMSSESRSGVVDLARKAMQLTIMLSQPVEQIEIGPDAWINSSWPSGIPGAPVKPWVHYHNSRPPPFPGFNPAYVLAGLMSPDATLKLVGHDIVRGVPTSHYEVMVPPPTPTTNAFTAGNGRVDVWVDSSDLVRQYRATSLLLDGTTHPYTSETDELTVEFFNFGVATDIEPPPDNQVSDANQQPGLSVPSTTEVKLPPGAGPSV